MVDDDVKNNEVGFNDDGGGKSVKDLGKNCKV